jgi:hypothetical protein
MTLLDGRVAVVTGESLVVDGGWELTPTVERPLGLQY